jgi:hypothetical protein
LHGRAYEVDRIKIFDFFLLFPNYIKNTRFPIAARKYRKYFNDLNNKYEKVDNPNHLYLNLDPYQTAALRCLASYEFIDPELLIENKVELTNREIPEPLKQTLISANISCEKTIKLLADIFADISLYGAGGLKDRSGLMEFRFDAV